MSPGLAGASLPSALNAMPTAAAVGLLCAAVIVEIVVLPAVLLPGGTVTLLAGALIGAGRPWPAVAIPVAVAVIAGDQLAYFGGAAMKSLWRRRRPEHGERDERKPWRRGAAPAANARSLRTTWTSRARSRPAVIVGQTRETVRSSRLNVPFHPGLPGGEPARAGDRGSYAAISAAHDPRSAPASPDRHRETSSAATTLQDHPGRPSLNSWHCPRGGVVHGGHAVGSRSRRAALPPVRLPGTRASCPLAGPGPVRRRAGLRLLRPRRARRRIAGIAAGALAIVCLLAARRRSSLARALPRRGSPPR